MCIASTRVFVQENIYDGFLQALQGMLSTIKVGDAFEEGVFNGPLINQAQLDKTLGYIEKGKQEGARLLIGGNRINRKGYFVEPTVFVDV